MRIQRIVDGAHTVKNTSCTLFTANALRKMQEKIMTTYFYKMKPLVAISHIQ